MIIDLRFSSGYSLIYSVACTVFDTKRGSGSSGCPFWVGCARVADQRFTLVGLGLLLDLSKYNLHRKNSLSVGSVF